MMTTDRPEKIFTFVLRAGLWKRVITDLIERNEECIVASIGGTVVPLPDLLGKVSSTLRFQVPVKGGWRLTTRIRTDNLKDERADCINDVQYWTLESSGWDSAALLIRLSSYCERVDDVVRGWRESIETADLFLSQADGLQLCSGLSNGVVFTRDVRLKGSKILGTVDWLPVWGIIVLEPNPTAARKQFDIIESAPVMIAGVDRSMNVVRLGQEERQIVDLAVNRGVLFFVFGDVFQRRALDVWGDWRRWTFNVLGLLREFVPDGGWGYLPATESESKEVLFTPTRRPVGALIKKSGICDDAWFELLSEI
jgi:hypothetical protein